MVTNRKLYKEAIYLNNYMSGRIIKLSDYRPMDFDREFYDLPLEDRFARYKAFEHQLYERRKSALEGFSEKETTYPKKRLTPAELTEELREIVPSFDGQVIDRFFFPFVAMHYIIEHADMEALFGESPFGRYTGKVIGESDGLLSPDHNGLSGLVIVQAKQPTPDKDRFIAAHELYHSNHFHYPNSERRDKYAERLTDTSGLTPKEIVAVLIGLDRAILIDEAGACIDAYDSLGDEQRHMFLREYGQEVRNSTRNILGFQLSAARSSGNLDEETVSQINQHEQASMAFGRVISQATQNLSHKLQNPENLEPLGYAMSYVGEALQILDFDEIPGGIESLCVEVLEPHRLNRDISFGQLFAESMQDRD